MSGMVKNWQLLLLTVLIFTKQKSMKRDRTKSLPRAFKAGVCLGNKEKKK